MQSQKGLAAATIIVAIVVLLSIFALAYYFTQPKVGGNETMTEEQKQKLLLHQN